MATEEQLRKFVREIINELLDEISTSAGAGPYSTPHAFKKSDDEEEEEELSEGRTRYHKLKTDQSRTARQKIGESMREAKRAIREVRRTVALVSRYKNEFGYSHDNYWKSTQRDIYKMEEDMIAISQKLRDLRL